MNVSFFLLILVLIALAFLTGWNQHVLLLLGVTVLLWASMAWSVKILHVAHSMLRRFRFVVEISKVQQRQDNMPAQPTDGLLADTATPEPKKDR